MAYRRSGSIRVLQPHIPSYTLQLFPAAATGNFNADDRLHQPFDLRHCLRKLRYQTSPAAQRQHRWSDDVCRVQPLKTDPFTDFHTYLLKVYSRRGDFYRGGEEAFKWKSVFVLIRFCDVKNEQVCLCTF